MKLNHLALAAVVTLVAASAVQADPIINTFGPITVTSTNLGSPVANSYGDITSPAWTAWKVNVSTSVGKIFTLDFGGTSGSAYTGFTGTLLQDADVAGRSPNFTYSTTPYEASATGFSTNPYGVDSHILIPATAAVVVLASATEDNDLVNPIGAPADYLAAGGINYGTGSFITFTYALNTANQAPSIDLAYLVLPTGQTPKYLANISYGTDAQNPVSNIVNSAVPEPASLGLLALGALGLIARRRKA